MTATSFELQSAPPAKLVVEGVSKWFRTPRATVLALDNIDLRVEEGEFVCLVGPSGCGKTTLLDILAGLTLPDQGHVLADDQAVEGPGRHRLVMFQEPALFPWLNVFGNVMFGLKRTPGLTARQRRDIAAYHLKLVGLEKFKRAFVHELSGGMKQRVALARTLAYHPAVLLMDEPFGALDAHTRTRLQNDLLNIWERDRKTVLFVTHSVDEAVFLSDKVVVMTRSPGRIKQVVDVDLPRPRRRSELLLDPHYQKYVVDIERMIDDTSEELRP